jgi:hypothetical protein
MVSTGDMFIGQNHAQIFVRFAVIGQMVATYARVQTDQQQQLQIQFRSKTRLQRHARPAMRLAFAPFQESTSRGSSATSSANVGTRGGK